MPTKLNTTFNAVELTQAELDSVTGGLSAAEELNSMRQAQDLRDAILQVSKSLGKELKNMFP
jgi:hypothetical protein